MTTYKSVQHGEMVRELCILKMLISELIMKRVISPYTYRWAVQAVDSWQGNPNLVRYALETADFNVEEACKDVEKADNSSDT